MSDNLREQLALLPDYLRGHLVLTITAMVTSICLSVPLGVWAAHSQRVRRPLLLTVSIIQTVPSLAILALVMAMLGGQIGFLPAFIALILYSMLPIVRNTVAGLEAVSKEVVEAAVGIGMSRTQILTKVRLPLAIPIIIAGIRTATVWTVGLATMSTLVGATSMGNYIFTGIQTRNLVAVTVGSIASAILAIALDGTIGGLQWLSERRTRPDVGPVSRKLSVGIAVTALILAGIAGYILKPPPTADFVVGGKPFTEQYILVGVLARELEDAGFTVDQRLGLGSDVVFDGTRNNSVDVYIEYSGTVWANHMQREDNPGKEAVQAAVIEYVEANDGIVSIGPAGFENRYALAMRRDRADELGVKSIEDLVPIADTLVCGADLEFFGRPEWLRLRDLYGFDFQEKLTFDASLMYSAVNERQVDLITAYTTDGRVSAFDLVIIEDPRDALLPYDGLIFASPKAGADPAFVAALTPLVNAISSETMREANKIVDVDGRPVSEAIEYIRSTLP